MQPLIFAHANSFPAGTYRLLFSLLQARGFAVHALDRFGHDTRYPVTNNWPHLVQQLADFAEPIVQRCGHPVFFVGHSLGGFVSTMLAAQQPHLAQGVLMLDSPLINGWRATSLEMVKRTQLIGSLSMGKISRNRRNIWQDRTQALAAFQSKKSFARWHPQVLQDYIDHGMHALPDGRITLHFSREEETAIYNTLPHHLTALLRRQPLRCPAAFIGGMHSKEMRQVGMDMTLRVTHGRTMVVDGGHLFPMEQPHVTAAAIEASLLNLAVAAHKSKTAAPSAR
jgi:pimeloyl-ACP methyl ester carboxylesterase